MIDVGGQQSPQLIYFGTDARRRDPSRFVVPIEVLAGVFFVLIALVFVGLGPGAGAAVRRRSRNRVVAYTADILGSLAGIAAFGADVLLPAPGRWSGSRSRWLSACCSSRRRRWVSIVCGLLALVGIVALGRLAAGQPGVETEVTWSPYYQVRTSRATSRSM